MFGYLLSLLNHARRAALRFLNWGAFGLLLVFLGFNELHFPQKTIVVRALFIVTACLLAFAGVVKAMEYLFVVVRSSANSIRGISCHAVWRFETDDGTLDDHYTFRLRNISSAPQGIVLQDREGFVVDTDFKPQYVVTERSKAPLHGTKAFALGQHDGIRLSEVMDHASGKPIYYASWSVQMEPPLIGYEEVSLTRFSLDKSVEKAAFSEQGTQFGCRCTSPFKSLVLCNS